MSSTSAGRSAYLQVYADATVDRDRELAVDVMMAVAGRMSGQPLPDEARPSVEEMCDREDRVVIRCRPYFSYATPPRHLHRNDQVEKLSHWVSGVVRGMPPTRTDHLLAA